MARGQARSPGRGRGGARDRSGAATRMAVRVPPAMAAGRDDPLLLQVARGEVRASSSLGGGGRALRPALGGEGAAMNGIHCVRGASGDVLTRGSGLSPDLGPRAPPSPPRFTLRKRSTGTQPDPVQAGGIESDRGGLGPGDSDLESGGGAGAGIGLSSGTCRASSAEDGGPGTKSDPVLSLLELIRDELVWTADCALCFVSDRALSDRRCDAAGAQGHRGSARKNPDRVTRNDMPAPGTKPPSRRGGALTGPAGDAPPNAPSAPLRPAATCH